MEFWLTKGQPLIMEWKIFHIASDEVADFRAAELQFFYDEEESASFHTYVDLETLYPLQRQDGFYIRFNTDNQDFMQIGKNTYKISVIDLAFENIVFSDEGIVNLYARD